MKKIIALLISASILTSPLTASSQTAPQSLIAEQQRLMAFEIAPIKQASDLKNHIVMTPKSKSPLRYLSPNAKREFLDSLTFNENGLTGFNYVILKNSVTSKQAVEILALFGAQRTASLMYDDTQNGGNASKPSITPMLMRADDHVGYYCSGRSTCNESSKQICMSSC